MKKVNIFGDEWLEEYAELQENPIIDVCGSSEARPFGRHDQS